MGSTGGHCRGAVLLRGALSYRGALGAVRPLGGVPTWEVGAGKACGWSSWWDAVVGSTLGCSTAWAVLGSAVPPAPWAQRHAGSGREPTKGCCQVCSVPPRQGPPRLCPSYGAMQDSASKRKQDVTRCRFQPIHT